MRILKHRLTEIRNFCLKHKNFLIAIVFLLLTLSMIYKNRPKETEKVENANVCRGTRAQMPLPEEYEYSPEEKEGGEEVEIIETEEISLVDAKEILQIQTDVPTKTAIGGWGISAGGDLVYWDQPSLDVYFQELKTLGANWIRWDVDWEAIQPYSPTRYNWTGTDRVAQTAKKYGIKSLGIITYAPQWSQNKICPAGMHCPPSDPQLFAKFAGEAAKRYEGTVDVWEIWNEPNYHVFWHPMPDAEIYTEILKASYVKIKENNPRAIVISGGLANAADEENVSISPITFVNAMYESDAKDYFDVLALHPYTYPGPNYGWPQVISVWNAMDRNGDGAKKIWITEYGAPTGGPGKSFEIVRGGGFIYGKDYMSESAQKQMAEEIFTFKARNSNRLGNVFWYSLCDSSDENSTSENFFGILRYDGSKKPVYETLKNIFKTP